ncbi:unnamed protein product [Effrenium voratum]|nr:unnamed protein product [Effrenium voratum]
MVVSVLMVAEKPSIAQTLADALSPGHKYSSRTGASPACKVHEYEGDFYGQRAWFKVTSCAGHVYSIDFPPEYNNWDRVEPLTLFGAPTVKQEANPKLRMPKHFQTEAKGCSYLVLWLDCDREGENICFEVIDNAVPYMSSAGSQQQVWRAQFSSLAPVDLKKAMATLGSPNKDMSDSVDARAEMDLKLGCAFTRFQTKYFQGKYGDLDTNLVSYGPCQTPTLWFCVRRSDEINAFQPESFYTIDVTVAKAGRDLQAQWDRGQVFDMPIASLFMNIIQDDNAKAVVNDVSQKEDRQARPQALNTVAMLKMASTRLGLGPQQAMHMAERLYLDGYLTYPRTETNTYPKNFDLQGAVRAQSGHPAWGSYSQQLLSNGLARPREGVDMGDHPPITPVRAATEGQLGDAYRLYDMITRHFLATVSGDCKFLRTRVNFTIVGEGFSVSGRKVIDPGFTAIQRSGEMEDVIIPDFKKGETIEIKRVSMGSHKTRPPSYLSESDLLSLMEKHGIGTDASMATHINNICERNYVKLAEGRRLIPTQLGIALVHGYQMVDNELVIPKVRANMEKNCTLVADGKAEVLPVVQHCLRLFREKFIYYVTNVELVDQLFETIFKSLEAAGRPLSRCGDCQRYLSVVDRKPVRMFCKTCNRIFKMPQNGQMKLYKELKCPLDNFELVFVANKVGKSYPICPMCYDDPPFGAREEQGKHWNLDHPIYKKYRPAVMSCIADNCSGTLCLDVDSGPKWQIDCNVCLQQLSIFEDKAHKIKATSDTCEECGSVLLEVIFNKGKSPLPDGELERKACLVCDEIFNTHTVSKTGKNFFRRNPGKGKGKGKGKKGKGGKGKMSEEDKAEARGRELARQKKCRGEDGGFGALPMLPVRTKNLVAELESVRLRSVPPFGAADPILGLQPPGLGPSGLRSDEQCLDIDIVQKVPVRGFCVSAARVKELRDRTGASMGKCREALKEEEGDLEKAVDWLKKRGVRSMEKRATESAEALLGLGLQQNGGAIVELRAETDFVTRSDVYQQTLRYLASTLAAAPDVAAGGTQAALEMLVADGPDRPAQLRAGTALSEALLELGSVLGEKLVLSHVHFLAPPPDGVVAGYVHPKFADSMPGTGRMAGLVSLLAPGCDAAALQSTAARLARHVVAAQPRFLSVGSISAETLRKEQEVFKAAYLEQVGPRKAGAVDEQVLKKVIDGKTNRFYQETVLPCQELVAPQAGASDKKPVPVAEWLQAEARQLGVEKILVEDFRLAVL